MKCLIVVLNWRAAERTLACVDSLVSNVLTAGHNLIIVDNNSGDGSFEKLKEQVGARYPHLCRDTPDGDRCGIHVIDSTANGGYAFGNNQALRWAERMGIGYDVVWIVNNDTIVKDDALQPLVAMMKARPEVGLVGSYLLNTSDSNLQCAGGVSGIKQLALFKNFLPGRGGLSGWLFGRQLVYLTGASMLVSRRLIDDIGLMEESFFLYFEEAEWQERALAAGYKLAVAPDSKVYHEGSATVGAASPFFYYMYSRSAILYLKKIRKGSPLVTAAWLLLACYLKTRNGACIRATFSGIKDGIGRSASDWQSQFFTRVNAKLGTEVEQ
ncbi:glycosyltransferase family 2 protein [Massilia sp. UBA6681]|uniref:glycosyltransferase family 2 protein n=1 Tax=Massilia sp. UBA6681 TaxID=1946839 RepID=UPI0025C0DF7C|nr:glycosyltransferase family 2 protein [Massilia sp. UBA6681]